MSTIKKLLLEAPDGQLDACVFPLIEKWDEPATAIQILEVLDKVIYAALGSGFVVTLLQTLYDEARKREGKTDVEVVALATWRNELAQ